MFSFNVVTKYLKKYKNNYTLKKQNSYSKLSKSPKINIYRNDIYFFDEKFNEHINTFISFIETKPNMDFKLFYKNLKTLIIKEKRNFNKFLFMKSHITGRYDSYDNKILLLREDNFYSIYHELLHCASRKIEGEKMNVGFRKFAINEKIGKITSNIGKALNEGYTTLLEKRYFDSIEHTQKRGYAKEKFISSIIEQIVGKDEMEKLYFDANLDGLIEYLKQFSNEEDIYSFLEYFDKILVTGKKKVKPKEAECIYKFIGGFLLKTHVYKLIMLFNNDKINGDEFLKSIDDFIILLSTNYVLCKKSNYYFLTSEFTDQILEEINEDLDNKQKNKIM